MSRFCVVIPHHLTYVEAVRRMKFFEGVEIFPDKKNDELAENLKAGTGELNLTIMGFLISGDLGVDSSRVSFSGNLSFLASFFKGKIGARIREQVEKTLLT